jgi:uncharacterized protein (DUF305 family)
MTPTATRDDAPATTSPAAGGHGLRTVLLAVIGVGLLLLGGGLAVALGIGGDSKPDADSVDVGFSRDMSAHHLQAVEMANLALERSTDDAVRGLAFDISSTQQNQVGRMQGWLALWGYSLTGGEQMAWMAGDEHAAHEAASTGDGLMPGMATDDELARLRSATGEDFDVLFLQLMIRHHQGGTEMAEYAQTNAGEWAVRRLATTIIESQTGETNLMVSMLDERGAEPLPAP